ncbi:MAG: 2-C-methyl-D-erythritol 2,4-cyclodiphosphate synthase [Candidatus Cloacimonetes bacterium]|nr:2-C-methyl-D-erythritol 2,4-cyclodiphosphate synthase [Candidatus Cloacimonadota bacterium]
MSSLNNYCDYSCIITAGGYGTRFDEKKKKQFFEINNRPLINITIELFYALPEINEILVTLPKEDFDLTSASLKKDFPNKVKCILGGDTRQKSVYNALQSCNEKNSFVLIHDAVRPFLDKVDLLKMIELVRESDSMIPGSRVKNTIHRLETTNRDSQKMLIETIPREDLIEVYTPQIFKLDLIKKYHEKAKNLKLLFSDDASIMEFFGEKIRWFETNSGNLKITTREDIELAVWRENRMTQKNKNFEEKSSDFSNIRIGYGYDVHQLVVGRKLIIGGVEIDFEKGLLGHSDADVLLHAIIDALLGALSLGDIGSNFPDNDKAYKNINSRVLLRKTYQIIKSNGWYLNNLDVTICAQKPKMRPYIDDMRKNIAEDLQCEIDIISVKATTEENLGISGSEKGMTATCIVMIRRANVFK